MQTTRHCLFVLFLLLLGLPLPRVAATNVSEPPDFPNSSTGVTATFTYNLTTGTNTFSGTVTTPDDGQDNFNVVVPAGLQILSITKNITGASSFSGGATFNTLYLDGTGAGTFPIGSVPLTAGTYSASVNANFSVGNPWTMTITVGPVPDYSIITQGGTMTVTNNSGNGDTLTVSEPSSGNIAFAAPGRTFRANTGALNIAASGSQSLIGVSTVQINGGAGNETINVGNFTNTGMSSLSITGGAGVNTVNFTGNITFVNNAFLSVDATASSAGTVLVNGGHLVAKGTGTITILCSKNVSLLNGAVLQTADGNIDVEANQQATATTGNFSGIQVDGAATKVTATSNGAITLLGVGGNNGIGSQIGVNLSGGAQVASANGALTVTGTGGAGAGNLNRGVSVSGAGAAITSTGGAITVTGTAGAQGINGCSGVSVQNGGKISVSSGSNDVTVVGTGSGASGSANQGVEIDGAATPASTITASRFVKITGTPGPGASAGLYLSDAAAIGPAQAVDIHADSLSLNDTVAITATASAFGVYLRPVAATQIDLGGASAAGTLGLPDATLDHVSTPTLSIGQGSAGITVSQPITRATATNLYLDAGASGVRASASGTDFDLAGGTLTLHGPLKMPITGAAADTGFPQLNVAGGVNLNGVVLDLSGTNLAGNANNTFTIVANDGTDAVTGTFAGLPEGAFLVGPGSPGLAAKISYVGGTGNDVVLTLVPVAQALTVNNTANDASLGSLQTVLAFAAANPGADTITFASTLSGQIITLTGAANNSAITLSDASPVTIDATGLPGGLTLQGGGPTGSFGLFFVDNGRSLTLRGLTLANGGGSGFNASGGAIFSAGTVTLINCTLSGNSCNYPGLGGGAIGVLGGTMTLFQCTLSGNSNQATNNSFGGAFYCAFGALNLTQCTVSSNSVASGGTGGAIYRIGAGTVTLTNSIVAGNTPNDITGSYTQAGTNLIGGNPLLAPLGSYGGPTQTMPPLLGSVAIDAGSNLSIPLDPKTNATFTTDQRGKARIQTNVVDIGAVETSGFIVRTAADDGSANSLRQIVTAANDITNTITFDPSLAGSSIPLGNIGFGISLSSNIAIDATALSGGITISGGGTNGSFRLFFIPAGTTVILRNLALANGGGSNFGSQGGALVNNGTLTATLCAFTGNQTALSGQNGGAIYNATGANLTLNTCALNGNTSANAAGGAISNSGTMTLNASTLNANLAASGGAIVNNGTLFLNQCTLAGNQVPSNGGAIYAGGGVLNITHCTVSSNTAGNTGGIANAGGTLTLTNSIVYANANADITNTATVVKTGANIVQVYAGTAATGSGNAFITSAPLLAPLNNYGGPTQTMALEPGSPARNTALNSHITTDQRGFPIVGAPDIGAYEAGTNTTNFNAYIYETLPATATVAQHAASFDYDGDGASNYDEFLAQTNPGDPASTLRITQFTRSGSNVFVTFPTVLGRIYSTERTFSLDSPATWTTNGSFSGTGSPLRVTIGPISSFTTYFVRVRVSAGP